MSKPSVAWTLEDAVENFLPRVQKNLKKEGWHSALGGSVLHKGKSDKDLDLFVYPHSTEGASIERMRCALMKSGLHFVLDVGTIHAHWRRLGSDDRKHVEAWGTKDGKRVDVFVWLVETP